MRHHVAACGILLVLLLASLSCAKLPEKAPASAPGTSAVERVASGDSIPQEWGALVAVAGELPTQKLWFQNEAGDLRVVGFNYETMSLDSLVFVIHRK